MGIPDAIPTSDGRHNRRDLQMLGKAIRERWPLPARTADIVPEVMLGIVEGSTEDRERIAAARVIVTMMGQNQADEHHTDKTAQGDKALALDAARTLAGIANADKIALVRRMGMGHLLPAEVQQNEAKPST